jgi:TrmH family RNA methyltransferase
MPVRIVQSKRNARLKELRRAFTRRGGLSHPLRDENGSNYSFIGSARGLVGVEGPNLIAEALRAALPFDCVFVAEDSERLLDTLSLPPETEILLLPRDLLSSALATETPQPIAALVQPPVWSWSHILPQNQKSLLVVLAGLQDPGNLGTILRSAEAFGATGVLSLTGTVSPWNPKAVRASAGSVFRVPLLTASPEDAFARLRHAGIKLWATAVHKAEPANRVDLAAPSALLIGNEGNGVPAELAAQADGVITIPCSGPVESLNAAVAASILLYEAVRQRAGEIPHPNANRSTP